MKRFFLLLAVVLILAAGNAHAHNKGDLMLNIDHPLSLAFPSIGLMGQYSMMPGFNFSLGSAVDYYFTDFFSLGAGLGLSGNYNVFLGDTSSSGVPPEVYIIPVIGWAILFWDLFGPMLDNNGRYFAAYVNIPFGFRFSAKAFSFGAGATANIPLWGFGNYESLEWEDSDGDKQNGVSFKHLPYMGWYADIGFDMSGKKDRGNGFGMLFRMKGSFTRDIAEPSRREFDPRTFRFITIDMVFRAAFELANIPIGRVD